MELKTFLEKLSRENPSPVLESAKNAWNVLSEAEDDITGTELGKVPEGSTETEISDIEGSVQKAIDIEKEGAADRKEHEEKVTQAVKDIEDSVERANEQ